MMETELELTVTARTRQQAMLPELLGAVRRRRRWRHTRNAGLTLALVAGLASAPWWMAGGAAGERPAGSPAVPDQHVVATRSWVTVRDDPDIVARYRVGTTRRSEWFVDDADLRGLLRTAERASGVVRSGQRVFVSRAAIDPWPEATSSE
ncbi:MAG: hypothetical protein NXI31_03740 [bacterium]|nr:hypothetical protein [bacterium]